LAVYLVEESGSFGLLPGFELLLARGDVRRRGGRRRLALVPGMLLVLDQLPAAFEVAPDFRGVELRDALVVVSGLLV